MFAVVLFIARLVRHSCDANLKSVMRMSVGKVPQIRLVAVRDIEPGEVLTLDFERQNCNGGMKFVSRIQLVKAIGISKQKHISAQNVKFDCLLLRIARVGGIQPRGNKVTSMVRNYMNY